MEEIHYKPLLCPQGLILPEKPQRAGESAYITLTAFLGNMRLDFKVARLIIAISIAVKTISATLRKKALSAMQVLGFDPEENITETEIYNEIFLQLIKDTGAVWQVGCATHAKAETFLEYAGAEFVVNFTAHDGLPNQPGTSTSSSAFAIFKRNPDPNVKDHTLQPSSNILYSGYAIYGPSTVLYISLLENRVDGFLLDPLIGEMVLIDENIKIPYCSPLYTINEGMSFYYSQKTLDWLERKKNPDGHKGAKGRYIVSKIADMHRILKRGGIYCHPYSKFMNVLSPHHLVYECQPMSHMITQAGGLATDGTSWFADIVPTHLHCTTCIYIGSPYEVVDILRYINKDLLQDEEELLKQSI